MEYSKLVLKSARKAWEKINIITEDKPTIFKDDKEFSEFCGRVKSWDEAENNFSGRPVALKCVYF